MAKILVRRLHPGDADAVTEVELLARTWAVREVPAAFEDDDLGPLSPDARARRAADLHRILQAGESWVALIDEQIVGFVAVVPHPALTAGEVLGFAIDPRWRGQGVASALLARSHGLLQARGLALAG